MSDNERNPFIEFDPDDKNISRSSCETRMVVQRIAHTWKIDNISINFSESAMRQRDIVIQSTKFTSKTEPNNFLWYLSLERKVLSKAAIVYLYFEQDKENLRMVGKYCFCVKNRDQEVIIMKRKMEFFGSALVHRLQLYTFDIDDLFLQNGRLVANDTLTIYCEITYSDYEPVLLHISAQDSTIGDVNLEKGVLLDVSRMHFDADTSDVTISVRGVKYPAHKFILAARSPVFRAMFKHNMRESRSLSVEIDDIGKEAFECLLKYMYTGRFPNEFSDVVFDLLMAAEKYQMNMLKINCEKKLLQNMRCENAARILHTADFIGCNVLKEAALTFLAYRYDDCVKNWYWCQLSSDLQREVHLRVDRSENEINYS